MRSASRCICLGLIGLLATQPGCVLLSAFLPRKASNQLDVSLLKAQGYSVPPGGMPAAVALDPNDGPRVILEIRADERHLETIPLPELQRYSPLFERDIYKFLSARGNALAKNSYGGTGGKSLAVQIKNLKKILK